ncbi:MAG: glycosyltransferase family 4 protein [Saprospiraceae bacterium]
MRVVLINTLDLQGGAAVACERLHQALLSHGVDSIRLVQQTSREKLDVVPIVTNPWQRLLALVREYRERLRFMLLERSKDVRFQFSIANTGLDISRHPAVQSADIIHLHWINKGFLSLNSLQKLAALGKPIVWTMHDNWPFTGGCHYPGTCDHYLVHCGNCPMLSNPSEFDISNQIWHKKDLIFADYQNFLFVACSKWLAQKAISSSLLKNHKVLSIPNPIDIDKFKAVDKAEAKIKLGLDPARKYMLFLAANADDPRKGFAYLKEALSKIKASTKDWSLLLVGKTNIDPNDLPLDSVALGSIPSTEIVGAYQAADVFVIPSLEDNLPNTVMEAMACGTPVIGFATGGIPEMVDHLINGYLTETGNSQGLADGFEMIMQNEELLKIWAIDARNKVLSHYQFEKVAAQYIEQYQSTLASLPQ